GAFIPIFTSSRGLQTFVLAVSPLLGTHGGARTSPSLSVPSLRRRQRRSTQLPFLPPGDVPDRVAFIPLSAPPPHPPTPVPAAPVPHSPEAACCSPRSPQ